MKSNKQYNMCWVGKVVYLPSPETVANVRLGLKVDFLLASQWWPVICFPNNMYVNINTGTYLYIYIYYVYIYIHTYGQPLKFTPAATLLGHVDKCKHQINIPCILFLGSWDHHENQATDPSWLLIAWEYMRCGHWQSLFAKHGLLFPCFVSKKALTITADISVLI